MVPNYHDSNRRRLLTLHGGSEVMACSSRSYRLVQRFQVQADLNVLVRASIPPELEGLGLGSSKLLQIRDSGRHDASHCSALGQNFNKD